MSFDSPSNISAHLPHGAKSRQGKVHDLATGVLPPAGLHRVLPPAGLHRDLKPENVLVTEQTVKVLDFGLASPAGKTQTSGGSLEQTHQSLEFSQTNSKNPPRRGGLGRRFRLS